VRPNDVHQLLARLGLGTPSAGWTGRARCAGMDPDDADRTFYPRRDQPHDEAVARCEFCPVWEACLAAEVIDTFTTGGDTRPVTDVHGIRAGMPASERRTLYRSALATMDRAAEAVARLDEALTA
jgi:hypothetical protein